MNFPLLLSTILLLLTASVAKTQDLTITTPLLSSGTVGVAYSLFMTVAGGTAPYTWSITAGSLPPGLAFSPTTGAIGGTPTSVGSFTFTVQVTDSAAATASQAYTLAVSSPGSPLSIVNASTLPSGTVGAMYSQTLVATGGTLPYSWSVSNGALPSSLTLNAATGAISGSPKSAGTFTVTIRVTDSAGAMASQVYTLTVISPGSPLTIATASPLSSGTVGSAYSQTIAVTGGTAPYTWSITAGSLPPGLAFSPTTGAMGGTPVYAGTFAFTVQVTDSAATAVSRAYTLGVNSPVPGDITSTGRSMAHFAAGGGWQTTFTFVNIGSAAADLRLNFFDDNGNPAVLPLVFPPSSSSPQSVATLDRTLNPNDELLIQTQRPASQSVLTGWAQLLSAESVQGYAVFQAFTDHGLQEAVVPLQSSNASSYVIPFDNTNAYVNGIAVANTTTQALNITLTIRDASSNVLGTHTLNLPALGHKAFVLTDPMLGYSETANTRGTLQFTTPSNGQMSVLGLRFNPAFAFTSIPALSK